MKSYKGQIVCQHLENVSREALEKYQAVIKNYVRRRHGIYALYRKNRLYYVGLASNLRNRLKHHLHDRHSHTWDRFSIYLTIKDAHLHELEALVLRIAAPKGNRQVGKFVLSQDLRLDFRRGINKYHSAEVDAIFGRTRSNKSEPELVHSVKTGRKPNLASYIQKRFKIRFRYKGKLYRAVVRRDGSILYNGKVYTSPSLAGKAVIRRACNGWRAWKYERAPGDWVLLDNLRKR